MFTALRFGDKLLNNDNIAEAFNCNPDALYIGFEIPFAMAAAAAKIASAKGIPVFVDAAPASKDYPLETLPPVEIFSPNETETFEYTGVMPKGAASCLTAAHSLFGKVKAINPVEAWVMRIVYTLKYSKQAEK